MRFLAIFAAVVAATTSAPAVTADPSRLLAPEDPAFASGWRPPASPTAGLRAYRPVDAKDWLELNKAGNGATGGTPGMLHSGGAMKGMPGMGGDR